MAGVDILILGPVLSAKMRRICQTGMWSSPFASEQMLQVGQRDAVLKTCKKRTGVSHFSLTIFVSLRDQLALQNRQRRTPSSSREVYYRRFPMSAFVRKANIGKVCPNTCSHVPHTARSGKASLKTSEKRCLTRRAFYSACGNSLFLRAVGTTRTEVLINWTEVKSELPLFVQANS